MVYLRLVGLVTNFNFRNNSHGEIEQVSKLKLMPD